MDDLHGLVVFLLEAAQRRAAAGDAGGAIALLEELLRIAPDHAPAMLRLAGLQLEQNPPIAVQLARRLSQLIPQDIQGWTLLGQGLSAVGRADEAVQAFRHAASSWPTDAHAQSNLSVALLRAGDPLSAIAAAERATVLAPAMPEGFANLGHAYNVLERNEAALAAFQQALNLRPNFPDALKGLARAQKNAGRPSSGIIALLRAVELSPRAPGLHFELATLYQEMGELSVARLAIETAMSLSGGVSPLASNALMGEQYAPDSDEAEAARSARRWGLRQIEATCAVAKPARLRPCPGGKLKIGYVSADLYRHPVGWLGAGPIAAHDRDAFHVTVYANQTCADWVSDHVKAAVDSWVPILGLGDDAVAARIVADEIDILVDLSGHTAGNRLAVFARRPAPLQVTWLGYFATTGLPVMDYVLMDAHHLVKGAEALFSERVVRLPDCRFCYMPPRDAPAVAPPPSAASGRVTFGSFNNAAKINAHVIALWSKVLEAVADSRLVLKWRSFADPVLQARLRSAFAAHGVEVERIRFDGHTPHEDMLRQYAEIDIALDPFPFSGGLTSCEALWMGVPVMTLPGPRPVSRQTHAILKTIGHAEWSFGSPAAFVETIAALARDHAGLAAARQRLRQDVQASPLCDAGRFAANLETVFRQCAREKTASSAGTGARQAS